MEVRVFILNCVDGCIPSDLATGTTEEIEEERRLLYVAMTRAKDHLHLIVAQRFYSHQQQNPGSHHMYAARTRFIEPSMLQFFANVAWPTATTSDVNKSRLHKESVYRHATAGTMAIASINPVIGFNGMPLYPRKQCKRSCPYGPYADIGLAELTSRSLALHPVRVAPQPAA